MSTLATTATTFITFKQLDAFEPDVIFFEGGLVKAHGALRAPLETIARWAASGTVVIVADVDWNAINQHQREYSAEIAKLFGVTFAFGGDSPAEIFDPVRFFDGHRQIVRDRADMAYESWLGPLYPSQSIVTARLHAALSRRAP